MAKVANTTGASLSIVILDTNTINRPKINADRTMAGMNSRANPHENHESIMVRVAISFTSPMPISWNLVCKNKPSMVVATSNRIEIPNLAHSPCQIAKVSQHNKVVASIGKTILLGTLP